MLSQVSTNVVPNRRNNTGGGIASDAIRHGWSENARGVSDIDFCCFGGGARAVRLSGLGDCWQRSGPSQGGATVRTRTAT